VNFQLPLITDPEHS